MIILSACLVSGQVLLQLDDLGDSDVAALHGRADALPDQHPHGLLGEGKVIPDVLLTVTVPDDDIATLAADDVGALIGRGDGIVSPVRGLVAVVCPAMEISDVATLCDECDQLALGWEAQIRGNESGVVVP